MKRKYLVILFSLSLVLRLLYTFIPQIDYFYEKKPTAFMADNQSSDSGSYVLIAKGFLKYGYPARGTEDDRLFLAGGLLYPLLLAINLFITKNLFPLIFLQLILDSLIPVLLFALTYKLTNSSKASFITALLYTFYYPNYQYAKNIGTDGLYVFFLFLGVFWVLYYYNNYKAKDYIIIGAIFSLASLVRAPILYPFIITLIIVLVYSLITTKKINKGLIIAFVIFWIFQLPVLLISYNVSGKFVLGSTGGSVVLIIGTFLPANGDNDEAYLKIYPEHPINYVDSLEKTNKISQIEKDSIYSVLAKKQIIDNFKNHFFESIKVMSIQFSRFWFNFPYYTHASLGTRIITVINSLLLISGILGIIFFIKRINFSALIIIIGLVFYQGLHLLVFNQIRYSAPLMPVLLFFVGIAIFYFLNKYNQKLI